MLILETSGEVILFSRDMSLQGSKAPFQDIERLGSHMDAGAASMQFTIHPFNLFFFQLKFDSIHTLHESILHFT